MTESKEPMTDKPDERLSDEALRAILAGTEGVTPGPWHIDGGYADNGGHWTGIRNAKYADVIGEFGATNDILGYLVSLDPQTVASLVTELLARRSAHAGVGVKALEDDDLASDERWNAGVDYAITQLCNIIGVDPKSISWDAATETLDGDVSAVICNAIRGAYGDEWSSKPETTARIRSALEPEKAE